MENEINKIFEMAMEAYLEKLHKHRHEDQIKGKNAEKTITEINDADEVLGLIKTNSIQYITREMEE